MYILIMINSTAKTVDKYSLYVNKDMQLKVKKNLGKLTAMV